MRYAHSTKLSKKTECIYIKIYVHAINFQHFIYVEFEF